MREKRWMQSLNKEGIRTMESSRIKKKRVRGWREDQSRLLLSILLVYDGDQLIVIILSIRFLCQLSAPTCPPLLAPQCHFRYSLILIWSPSVRFPPAACMFVF